jgi:hypothetical protein
MDQFLSIIFFDARLKNARRELPAERRGPEHRSIPRRLGFGR